MSWPITCSKVTVSGSDPVREGWAKALARPGGNITGLTVTFPGLLPKCLEFLKESFPWIDRVALLMDASQLPDGKQLAEETEAAARLLKLKFEMLNVAGANDFEAAFARVGMEMTNSHPRLAEQLGAVVLELRAGRWK